MPCMRVPLSPLVFVYFFLSFFLFAQSVCVFVFVGAQVSLRRLVYCAVRVMAGMSQDVIIVTSSLTKDMTGKVGRRE